MANYSILCLNSFLTSGMRDTTLFSFDNYDALSLYLVSKEIKKSLSARDAGSLTSRVNDSVMARLVVPIQAIFDPLQGN